MKKLVILAMIGMISLTSCSNENEEFISNPTTKPNVKELNKDVGIWGNPSKNPLELDGYLHINYITTETIFMGEKLELLSNSHEYFKIIIDAVNSKKNESARVQANVMCATQVSDMNIAIVNVCNSGNCQQYTVYTYDSGNQYVYANNSNYVLSCASIYIYGWGN